MSTMPPLLFLAGSPGPLELLVIFAAILVLFGPRRLPEIARSIGRMLHELRKASDDFRSQVMSIEDSVEKTVETQAREGTHPENERMASASLREVERPREPVGGAKPPDSDDAGSPL